LENTNQNEITSENSYHLNIFQAFRQLACLVHVIIQDSYEIDEYELKCSKNSASLRYIEQRKNNLQTARHNFKSYLQKTELNYSYELINRILNVTGDEMKGAFFKFISPLFSLVSKTKMSIVVPDKDLSQGEYQQQLQSYIRSQIGRNIEVRSLTSFIIDMSDSESDDKNESDLDNEIMNQSGMFQSAVFQSNVLHSDVFVSTYGFCEDNENENFNQEEITEEEKPENPPELLNEPPQVFLLASEVVPKNSIPLPENPPLEDKNNTNTNRSSSNSFRWLAFGAAAVASVALVLAKKGGN